MLDRKPQGPVVPTESSGVGRDADPPLWLCNGTDAPMILLSRLNGSELGVNADLIERVESNPDTVITLVDGTKYVVSEPATEVIARIVEFRALILAKAEAFAQEERPGTVAVPLRLVEPPAERPVDTTPVRPLDESAEV